MPLNRTTECECGRPKERGELCCERCAFLDGVKPRQREIIETLRDTNGMNVRDLCLELFGFYDANNNGTVIGRTLQVMLGRGRLARFWREGEVLHVARSNRWASGKTMRACAAGSWVYVLAGDPDRVMRRAA